MQEPANVLAVDVGSSHVKFGWFPSGPALAGAAPLAEPAAAFRVEHRDAGDQWTREAAARLDELRLPEGAACAVASVHPQAAELLMREVVARRTWCAVAKLTADDLSIDVRVDEPLRVGVDRLLGAVAANAMRDPSRPAIVIDMGTATTVNFVAADGAFEGGAIMAGPTTTLAGLHAATASLPLLNADCLTDALPAVGKSTEAAMAAGAYWGSIGAVNELVRRIAEECDSPPELFLTGGASAALAKSLAAGQRQMHVAPHLVLQGAHLAAQAQWSR